MKKKYESPSAIVAKMSFDEHITASGDTSGGGCSFNWFNKEPTYNGECAIAGSGTGSFAGIV